MEEALYDTAVIRRSAGTNGVDRSPHETTILDVRRLLETYGLGARMLEAAKGYPQKQGLSLRAAGWWMPRQRMQVASREHPFRVIKQQFGYTKVRCRGLAKTSAGADPVCAVQSVDDTPAVSAGDGAKAVAAERASLMNPALRVIYTGLP